MFPVSAERATRSDLLAKLDQLRTPAELWAYQRRLIDEIIAVEPRALGARDPYARRHLRCLRAFGDALAWRFLHEYSIRQLAKNPGPRPALYNQLGLALTIETAETLCTAGVPALIADLTNCLTVSDVIVCVDPERPQLIECGGNPRYANRGRKGRQHHRARQIAALLESGTATLLGDAHSTSTVTANTGAEHNYGAVQAAIENGWAAADSGDIVIALEQVDHKIDLPDQVVELIGDFSMPMIGVHTGGIDDPDPLQSPVHSWPLPLEQRARLLESEIALVHAVDFGAERAPIDEWRVRPRLYRGQLDGLIAEHEDLGAAHISPRLANDVMVGFATFNSMCAQAVGLIQAGWPEGATRAVAVDTIEEARAISEADPTVWVSLPVAIGAELRASV